MLTQNTYKMVEGYRRTDSLDEIEGLFKYWAKKAMPITIWQKKEHGRIIKKMYVDELNPLEPEIRLYPVEKDMDLKDLQLDLPVYIHTPFNKVITETHLIYIGREHLFIGPPNDIYIWDKQKIPRIKINTESSHVTFLKQEMIFECPLIDISNSGMAFRIGKNPAKYFSFVEDEIVIEEIFQQKLKERLKGNVVYLKELNKERSEYRVGIKFQQEIDLADSIPNVL